MRKARIVLCTMNPPSFAIKQKPALQDRLLLADEVGFEPTNELPRYRISSAGRYDHFDTHPLCFILSCYF